MKTSKRFLITALVLLFLITLSSCGKSTGSKGSSGVPHRVEAAVMDMLNINTSMGGKIISIEGNVSQEYPDGSELWKVKVKFQITSNTGIKEMSLPVKVD